MPIRSLSTNKNNALSFLKSLLTTVFEGSQLFDNDQSTLDILCTAGLCERGQQLTDLPHSVFLLHRLIESTRLHNEATLSMLQKLQRTIDNKLRVEAAKINKTQSGL